MMSGQGRMLASWTSWKFDVAPWKGPDHKDDKDDGRDVDYDRGLSKHWQYGL